MRMLAAAATILVAWPLAVLAQPAPPCPQAPAPYKLLRFDEDYGYLRTEACRVDFWDGLKRVPSMSDGERHVSFGGDARVRLESGGNVRYGPSPLEPRNDVVQRYHLHADARLNADARAFIELKSNQVSGREPGPIATDVDRLDVHQAFVDLGPLRIGRQEFAYGSGRRLFPRNGPNVRGSFDALRAMTHAGDWKVDALLFQPVAIDAGKFDDTSLHDQRFWGLYATGPAAGPFRLDLYYLGADRDPARFSQGLARERRHTFGARWFGRIGAWDFDLEPALQGGRFGTGAIRAWAVGAEIGRAMSEWPLRPRVALRVNAASGDRDPADPRLETFNSLFPRGGATGETWNFAAANLLHLRLGLDLALGPRVSASFGVDGAWRNSLRDGVYGPGGNPVPVTGTTRARAVGGDVDALLTWRVSRQLSLNVVAGYFRNGAYSREAGLGRRQWLVFPYAIFQF